MELILNIILVYSSTDKFIGGRGGAEIIGWDVYEYN